ncbi:uncharacterized protein BDW70DRAFT_130374 [Aspergillus foveolatus]|uniref:uncharacterized protein n=1 Tax=Aspergillus foveolatus TaxID=210207 RepID=UPI003CCCE45B
MNSCMECGSLGPPRKCHAHCKERKFTLLTQSVATCLISFEARLQVGILWVDAVQTYPHASELNTRIRHAGWDLNAMRGLY